jgi:hypothetical protein
MKVVAGSCGNDAIGPLKTIGGGMLVCPHEWGPLADGSVHINCEFSGALSRRRSVAGAAQIASVRGAFA